MSSNSRERTMSLESGITLCRLNQELLPEPGRPIASTTRPLGGRWVAGIAAGPLGAWGTCGRISSPGIDPSAIASLLSGDSASTGAGGIDPLIAAGENA